VINEAELTYVIPAKFTGKERDAESGDDYFGARYYASSMGRCLSADWSAKEGRFRGQEDVKKSKLLIYLGLVFDRKCAPMPQ
jgi:RHS repeat-associated protein